MFKINQRLLTIVVVAFIGFQGLNAAAFTISGRIIDSNGNGLANDDIVLLKKTAIEGQPPLAPIARQTTTADGSYSFKDLEADFGQVFLIGINVNGKRLPSNEIIYSGQDIIYTFNLTFSVEAQQQITITGRLLGNNKYQGLDSFVSLNQFVLDEQGELTSSNVAETKIMPDLSFKFSNVKIAKNSGLKLSIAMLETEIYGDLFFPVKSAVTSNLNIPFVSDDVSLVRVDRHSMVLNLVKEGLLVSNFINLANSSSEIFYSENSGLSLSLPAGATGFKSGIAGDRLRSDNNQLKYSGPIAIGTSAISYEYIIPLTLPNESVKLNWFGIAMQAGFLYRPQEIEIAANAGLGDEVDLKLESDEGYKLLPINPGLSEIELDISRKYQLTSLYYIFGAIFSIPIFLCLGYYFYRRKSNQQSLA